MELYLQPDIHTAMRKVSKKSDCAETILLNRVESERFLKALVAPPVRATARMSRALDLCRKTVTER
jgi:hypothetical protein